MKKLQNDFTTPEQSKQLLELGVPANSANCCLRRILTDGGYCEVWIVDVFDFIGQIHDDYLPCWSGCRLMEIIAECYQVDMPFRYFVRGGMMESLINTFIVLGREIDFSKLED